MTENAPRESVIMRLAASLIAEVGGELIGGAPGAGFAAVSSVALGYAAEFDRRSAQQADALLSDAQRSAGITPEEFAAWAGSDEHLRLVALVIDASWRTRNADKRAALSGILTDGIRDDAQLDISSLLAEALRDLEAPHLRLLAHMASNSPPPPFQYWVETALADAFPKLSVGLPSLLAALQRTGCLGDVNTMLGAATPMVVTTFGHALLAYVRRGTEVQASDHALGTDGR